MLHLVVHMETAEIVISKCLQRKHELKRSLPPFWEATNIFRPSPLTPCGVAFQPSAKVSGIEITHVAGTLLLLCVDMVDRLWHLIRISVPWLHVSRCWCTAPVMFPSQGPPSSSRTSLLIWTVRTWGCAAFTAPPLKVNNNHWDRNNEYWWSGYILVIHWRNCQGFYWTRSFESRTVNPVLKETFWNNRWGLSIRLI